MIQYFKIEPKVQVYPKLVQKTRT